MRLETDPVGVGAVHAFLTDKVGSGVESVAFLARGGWSSCYSFRAAGVDQVVRFGSHLEDFEKDRSASRYAGPSLPIPAVSQIGEAFDGYYAIAQRVFGTPINQLDQHEWRSILPRLFAALDATREADISATTGFGLWDTNGRATHQTWRDYLVSVGDDGPTRRIHGWRKRLKESPTGDEPFLEALERLGQLVDDCPNVRHLVHSDLLQNNLLVSEGEISGLIDWGCSLYGDFLYDHAWLAFCASWFPAMQGIEFISETIRHLESVGLATDDVVQRMRCYQIHIGLGSQAYSAFTGQWDSLAFAAECTAVLVRQ